MVTSDVGDIGASSESGGRQLKVEDALAYLEQVKTQFVDSPQVYNNFLDIMKEFKAQSIDTAEVIRRVSQLFSGHRALILGFNTFLPPGYKIEVREERNLALGPQDVDPVRASHGMATGHPRPPVVTAPAGAPPEMGSHGPQAPHVSVPPSEHSGRPAQAPTNGFGTPAAQAAAAGKPVEFDQAVSYVNKIKSRFQHDEDVYRTFLDILQTYQKDEKTIQEVYKQVASLFRDHQDLLDEFAHFLPESTQQAEQLRDIHQQHTQERQHMQQQAQGGPGGAVTSGHSASHAPNRSSVQTSRPNAQMATAPILTPAPAKQSKEKGLKATATSGRGSRKAANSGATAQGSPATAQTVVGATAAKGGAAAGRKSASAPGTAQAKKPRRVPSAKKIQPADAKAVLLALERGNAVGAGSGGSRAGHNKEFSEMVFFEELRTLMGDAHSYSEFIKCLSLFSQEIIKGDELMQLADGLLGHRKYLCDAFRAFLNQSDPQATETAIDILRRGKASGDHLNPGASVGGVGPGNSATAAGRSSTKGAVAGAQGGALEHPISGVAASHTAPRSPRYSALYRNRRLSDIALKHGMAVDGSPSYISLPTDFAGLQCSGMSPGDAAVLNSNVVCVSGSAGQRTLLGHESTAEVANIRELPRDVRTGRIASRKALSADQTKTREPAAASPNAVKRPLVEDQRMELDVLIESLGATIRKLERLISGERNAPALSPFELRPVDVIYGPAFDMSEAIRSNPTVVVPVVVARLKQRESDLRESKKELEKLWGTKRFTQCADADASPRSWTRKELVGELPPEPVGVGGQDTAVAGQADVPADVECHPLPNSGETKHRFRSILVTDEDNVSVLFKLLEFMIAWEVDGDSAAPAIMDVVKRIHTLLSRRGCSGVLFADEHLFHMTVLISALSERIDYILSHDYDGVTVTRILETVTLVLSGSLSLVGWEEACLDAYGSGRRWETLLVDFPILLRRFMVQASKLPRRSLARAMLDMADKHCGSEASMEDVAGIDNSYRNEAVQLIYKSSTELGNLISIKFAQMTQQDFPGLDSDEARLVLEHNLVRKPEPEKWRGLEAEEADEGLSEPPATQLTRFVRRQVRVRSRKRSAPDGSADRDDEGLLVRKDSLDIRLSPESGNLCYVGGTEDLLWRKRRRVDPSNATRNAAVPRAAARFRSWHSARLSDVGPPPQAKASAGNSHAVQKFTPDLG